MFDFVLYVFASQSSTGTVALDPPTGVQEEGSAFDSAIYQNLAGKGAPLHEKVRAGYKLIGAQQRDLSKMQAKLSELEKTVADKTRSIDQL